MLAEKMFYKPKLFYSFIINLYLHHHPLTMTGLLLSEELQQKIFELWGRVKENRELKERLILENQFKLFL